MPLDLQVLEVATEEVIDDLERLNDVEIADLMAAVFGAWSLLISLFYLLSMHAWIAGILPSLLIFLASGWNVYLRRQGQYGVERLNQISIFAGLWMMLASGVLHDHTLMAYSNTFAGMWVGISSTYASFLRQNDRNRETVFTFNAFSG